MLLLQSLESQAQLLVLVVFELELVLKILHFLIDVELLFLDQKLVLVLKELVVHCDLLSDLLKAHSMVLVSSINQS